MSARLRLAAVLVVACAVSAAADEGAYLTLLSMGRAVATDRGPDGGPPPVDLPPAPHPTPAPGVETEAVPDGGSGSAPTAATREGATAGAYAPAASAPSGGEVRADAAPSPRRRRWLRSFFVLSPSRRRTESFAAPAVSTAAARGLPASGLEDDAVLAGSRRGMAELLSITAEPLEP